MAKPLETFDKNTPRGLLDGPLGGLLGGLSGEGEFRPSWGPLGASLDLLTLEASFCCKNTIFLTSWGSYGLAGAREIIFARCP